MVNIRMENRLFCAMPLTESQWNVLSRGQLKARDDNISYQHHPKQLQQVKCFTQWKATQIFYLSFGLASFNFYLAREVSFSKEFQERDVKDIMPKSYITNVASFFPWHYTILTHFFKMGHPSLFNTWISMNDLLLALRVEVCHNTDSSKSSVNMHINKSNQFYC